MRKFNKLLILISIILLSFACMGCKSDYESFIDQFDLEDEKIEWDGNAGDKYIRYIYVTLKKTDTYPLLELEYLGLGPQQGVMGFKYIYRYPPQEYYEEDRVDEFRQTVAIYFSYEIDFDKIYELIQKIYELEFVRSIEFNKNDHR